MAIAATCVWEVQTGGNDANGGGFITGATGTDYSQQTSPQVTIDGATITATVHTTATQLNIVGYTVAAGDVGNILNIDGGTATAGRYQITVADVANNRWTLDRECGTAAQTATGRMGGCLATPGQLGLILSTANQGANNQKAYIKSGTYTLTTATLGPAGPFKNTGSGFVTVEGYQLTRGDRAARPVIHAGAVTDVTLWWPSYADMQVTVCIEVDGNEGSNNCGFNAGYYLQRCIGCVARNCTSNNAYGFLSGVFDGCSAINCFRGFYGGLSICLYCSAMNCTTGFATGWCFSCLAHGGTTGFILPSAGIFVGCIADECSLNGFKGGSYSYTSSCLATNHSGVGDSGFSLAYANGLARCAGYNNATHVNGTAYPNLGFQTLTADPYVSQPNDDFNLNNDAGGGAVLRAVEVTL